MQSIFGNPSNNHNNSSNSCLFGNSLSFPNKPIDFSSTNKSNNKSGLFASNEYKNNSNSGLFGNSMSFSQPNDLSSTKKSNNTPGLFGSSS